MSIKSPVYLDKIIKGDSPTFLKLDYSLVKKLGYQDAGILCELYKKASFFFSKQDQIKEFTNFWFYCYYDEINEISGVSKKTIQRTFNRLKDLNFINSKLGMVNNIPVPMYNFNADCLKIYDQITQKASGQKVQSRVDKMTTPEWTESPPYIDSILLDSNKRDIKVIDKSITKKSTAQPELLLPFVPLTNFFNDEFLNSIWNNKNLSTNAINILQNLKMFNLEPEHVLNTHKIISNHTGLSIDSIERLRSTDIDGYLELLYKYIAKDFKAVKSTLKTEIEKTTKEVEISAENYSKEFEDVWKDYSKPKDKKLAYKQYLKLSKTEKDILSENVKIYVEIVPNRTYRKDFHRFINHKTFLEVKEMITPENAQLYKNKDNFYVCFPNEPLELRKQKFNLFVSEFASKKYDKGLIDRLYKRLLDPMFGEIIRQPNKEVNFYTQLKNICNAK